MTKKGGPGILKLLLDYEQFCGERLDAEHREVTRMSRLTVTEENAARCREAVELIDGVSKQFKRHFPLIEAGDSGLTSVQRRVLDFILLATMEEEIYQKDVEEKFHIRRSTATGILKLMEKNGFIRRESVERDARLKRIVPTEKAAALREEVLDSIHSLELKMAEGIGKEEFETCIRVLEKISENLSRDEREAKKG